MAVRRAKGKKSVAISDRSGFKVPYRSLKTTWDGLRVEPEEYEPKHPQLTPARNVVDATALFDPRPDNDPENKGMEIAKAYAVATGGHRAGVLESSFVAEVKSDLMGEQTILCGILQTGSILCFDKMILKV